MLYQHQVCICVCMHMRVRLVLLYHLKSCARCKHVEVPSRSLGAKPRYTVHLRVVSCFGLFNQDSVLGTRDSSAGLTKEGLEVGLGAMHVGHWYLTMLLGDMLLQEAEEVYMYMFMYVCVCIYIHIYACVHVCMCIYVCVKDEVREYFLHVPE
jgi:hypothetical protein